MEVEGDRNWTRDKKWRILKEGEAPRERGEKGKK